MRKDEADGAEALVVLVDVFELRGRLARQVEDEAELLHEG